MADYALQTQVEAQRRKISEKLVKQVEDFLEQAKRLYQEERYPAAREEEKKAQSELSRINPDDLKILHEQLPSKVEDQIAKTCWKWARQALEENDSKTAAQCFREAAQIRCQQNKPHAADALLCLADRYANIPQGAKLTPGQIASLLQQATCYLDASEVAGAKEHAYEFAKDWLEETFKALSDHVDLYLDWAKIGLRLTLKGQYPRFDERLDELDSRCKASSDRPALTFRAWVAGERKEHEKASALWEQVDELELAAQEARKAGQPRQAIDLLTRASEPIPDGLRAVINLLDELEGVKADRESLTEGDRTVLASALKEVAELLKNEGSERGGD